MMVGDGGGRPDPYYSQFTSMHVIQATHSVQTNAAYKFPISFTAASVPAKPNQKKAYKAIQFNTFDQL